MIFRLLIFNQVNMFIDRRFGEYDEKMIFEDKMMKRFIMEKKVKIYRNIWLDYLSGILNLYIVLEKIFIFYKLFDGILFLLQVQNWQVKVGGICICKGNGIEFRVLFKNIVLLNIELVR